MKVAGFDIGGANTDLAIIDYENDEIKEIKTDFEFLPMWCENDRLGSALIGLRRYVQLMKLMLLEFP